MRQDKKALAWFGLVVLLGMVLEIACSRPPETKVTIADWMQDYTRRQGEWEMVTVTLKVEQIGRPPVQPGTVDIRVTCEDESVYNQTWPLPPVPKGTSRAESFFINTEKKKVVKVEIIEAKPQKQK